MNLSTKQKETHRYKNKLMVTKGEIRGYIRILGLTDTYYYI